MNMSEETRLIDLLMAEGWSAEKIVRAIKYVENGLNETPTKEEIEAYLNKKD